MKVLGLRASTQEIRYAILEKDAQNSKITFVNQHSENRLKYPQIYTKLADRLLWVKDEIDRILRNHTDIRKIIVKTNEFVGSENKSKRETSYVDAIFLLCAAEHGIPIERKLYSQIGASSKKAQESSESLVGRTASQWNKTIADAILAANWGIKHDI